MSETILHVSPGLQLKSLFPYSWFTDQSLNSFIPDSLTTPCSLIYDSLTPYTANPCSLIHDSLTPYTVLPILRLFLWIPKNKEQNVLDWKIQIHGHYTRLSHHYRSHYARINTKEFSIHCIGPVLWNNLPEELKTLYSINSFKYHLKQLLINN